MVKGANLEQLNSFLCRLRQRYPTAIAHELFERVEAVERQTTGHSSIRSNLTAADR
jgi:uncharacterized protein YcbK (DUF882 family)